MIGLFRYSTDISYYPIIRALCLPYSTYAKLVIAHKIGVLAVIRENNNRYFETNVHDFYVVIYMWRRDTKLYLRGNRATLLRQHSCL